LDCGVALGTVVIFVSLSLAQYVFHLIESLPSAHHHSSGGVELNWIGNTIGNNTADVLRTPLRILADGEWFGLKTVRLLSWRISTSDD
jgi:hypothetical protein